MIRGRGLHAAAAQETHAHLQRLLNAAALDRSRADWLRQVPRYLEGRGTALAAAASPAAPNRRRSCANSRNGRRVTAPWQMQVGAELRWLPQLDELRFWIEEYRVSLYAQELKTLGPVRRPRLEQRAAEIAAWLVATSDVC